MPNRAGGSPEPADVRVDVPAPGWHGGVIREDRRPDDIPADAALVVKIGGSLLVRPDWPALVAALVAGLDAPRGSGRADAPEIDRVGDQVGFGGPRRLVVVGGGRIVDGLRAIDAAASIDQSLVHDLAIDAMRLTARLVAAAVGLPLAAAASPAAPTVVLDVPAWLAVGGRAAALPRGWQVTSDSIAALVAVEQGAGLLLAKSAAPPPCPVADSPENKSAGAFATPENRPLSPEPRSRDRIPAIEQAVRRQAADALARLAAAGWVDDHFPLAAAPLGRITWAAPCRSA